jgi:hypothetical protein
MQCWTHTAYAYQGPSRLDMTLQIGKESFAYGRRSWQRTFQSSQHRALPRGTSGLVRTSGRGYGCKAASLINQRNETAQRKNCVVQGQLIKLIL